MDGRTDDGRTDPPSSVTFTLAGLGQLCVGFTELVAAAAGQEETQRKQLIPN
jgi:hypothetical protein